MTGFSDQAEQHTAKLQQAVLVHPFNEELSAGTLAPERFKFYLAQDARYLAGFARALAVAAARAPEMAVSSLSASAAPALASSPSRATRSAFDQIGLPSCRQ